MFRQKKTIIEVYRERCRSKLFDLLKKSNATLIAPSIIEFSDAAQADHFYAESQSLITAVEKSLYGPIGPSVDFNPFDSIFPLNSDNKPLTHDEKGKYIGLPSQSFTKIRLSSPTIDGLQDGLEGIKGSDEWNGRFEGGKYYPEPKTTAPTFSSSTEEVKSTSAPGLGGS